MEFLSQKLIIFFALAFVGSYAALPSEVFWNNALPNTPMPSAVKDLLPSSSDTVEDEGSLVGVNGGGADANPPGGDSNVNIGYPGGSVHVNPPGGSVDVGYPGGRVRVNPPGGDSHVNVGYPGGSVHVNPPEGSVDVGYPGGGVHVNPPGGGSKNPRGGVHVSTAGGTDVNVGPGGIGVGVYTPGGPTVSVGHGGVNVISGPNKGKPVGVSVFPGPSPFNYNYAASEDQLHDNPNVALFFLEKNMTRGSNMNLHFFKSSTGATFLPRHVAESIPFSSSKVAEIFKEFSVNPNSQEAEMMKSTIKELRILESKERRSSAPLR